MWIDIEQNSDAWFDLRVGKITSSNFAKIMANGADKFGDPAIKYSERIALEMVIGERNDEDDFKSVYMERGNEYEPIAKGLYEIETFRKVKNGGFFYENDLGDSPDGIVGERGRVEIKCVIAGTQFKRLKKGGYDTAYKWQIQGHLWVGDADWCDFVQYAPKMPLSKQLYIHRVHRDEVMISELEAKMKKFRELVKQDVMILKSA